MATDLEKDLRSAWEVGVLRVAACELPEVEEVMCDLMKAVIGVVDGHSSRHAHKLGGLGVV